MAIIQTMFSIVKGKVSSVVVCCEHVCGVLLDADAPLIYNGHKQVE